jgi:hypothetical protein
VNPEVKEVPETPARNRTPFRLLRLLLSGVQKFMRSLFRALLIRLRFSRGTSISRVELLLWVPQTRPPPQTPGRWDPNVKITPDPELLNGHKIPPLVPNVIDVRIMHHEVSATIESAGSISGQPVPAPNNAGSSGP